MLGIDVITPGVATVVARGDAYKGTTPPVDPAKVQTYTLVEQDGVWKIAACSNVGRSPVMERVQFLINPGSTPLRERVAEAGR